MKLVEKWTAKGGNQFKAPSESLTGADSNQGRSSETNSTRPSSAIVTQSAASVKTNAKRQLSVGEIMGEVMDNKKDAEYDRAKGKFRVEEMLLIEEAFMRLAQSPRFSRRGKVSLQDLPRLCLCLGLSPREHDVALLSAEVDPLDTRCENQKRGGLPVTKERKKERKNKKQKTTTVNPPFNPTPVKPPFNNLPVTCNL